MEDEPRSGRPCTSKTEENVTNLRTLNSDRHLTVTMIGSELNLNHQTVYNILTKELGIRTLGFCMTTTLPVNTAISVKEA
jgi:DNA invertase Pin-like site-specific DNA recombinase